MRFKLLPARAFPELRKNCISADLHFPGFTLYPVAACQGLKPHPDKIAETNSLSSVAPPKLPYKMSLPGHVMLSALSLHSMLCADVIRVLGRSIGANTRDPLVCAAHGDYQQQGCVAATAMQPHRRGRHQWLGAASHAATQAHSVMLT